MARVFIDGQAGTTGLEISQRLRGRRDVELLEIDEGARKDPGARRALIRAADVTILCLPDDAAREAVRLADGAGRLLDASTAHRIADGWAYGCPELAPAQRDAIAEAARVSNPGCYPQGFILLVRPLIEAGIVDRARRLCAFGLSGYSGGGRPMIERYQAFPPAQAERWNTRLYGLHLKHKHVPEMHRHAQTELAPLFRPSVGHYYRGMLMEVPLHREELKRRVNLADLASVLAERYRDEPFIEVLAPNPEHLLDDGFLDPCACNETNRVQLMPFGDDDRFLLIARYDNLGKGAAGAAIQNLNLMLGADETLGLT